MEPERATEPHLRDVLAELRALEPIFHGSNTPASREAYEALTAPDFWEVGASGQRYSREFVWSVIAARVAARDTSDETWQADDFQVRTAGCGTFLLTYTLRQEARVTRRLTVWQLRGGSWRVLYHQGTLVA
jgi:hypothetical protein